MAWISDNGPILDGVRTRMARRPYGPRGPADGASDAPEGSLPGPLITPAPTRLGGDPAPGNPIVGQGSTPPGFDESQQRRAMARSLYADLPPELFAIFEQVWVETGSVDMALAAMRRSDAYEQYYPGNLLDKAAGVVKFAEREYRVHRAALERIFPDVAGIDPAAHEWVAEGVTSWIRGDVSVTEATTRVARRADFVRTSAETTLRWFEQQGWGPVSVEGLIAAAFHPDGKIPESAFARRLDAARVGGAALEFGFERDAGRVDELMRRGLDPQAAPGTYQAAGREVPQLGAFADRYHDPQGGFGVDVFEEVALGAADPTRRRELLRARERATFSPVGGTAQRAGRLVGLRPQ